MKSNIGSFERILRIIGGLIVAISGIIFESYWGMIGVAILATGLFRFCPLYQLVGISTIKKRKHNQK